MLHVFPVVFVEQVPATERSLAIALAVYPVMARPPLLSGADQLTLMVFGAMSAFSDKGAEGVVTGIAWATGELALSPSALLASTDKE
jgi:hypothetical protein